MSDVPLRARRLAIGWLLVVLAMAGHGLWLWSGDRLHLETDMLAMLPQRAGDRAVQDATRQLADAAGRRVVVLVGAPDWPSARTAADAYAAAVGAAGPSLALRYRVGDDLADDWIGFFTPYRHQLLTDAQRAQMETEPADRLAARAVEALYRPFGLPRVGTWQDDPLNLFGGWLAARAAESPVRVVDGRLSVAGDGRQYALLMLEQHGPAFSIAAQRALMPVLDAARAAALAAVPAAEVVNAGVPLYAARAAEQAHREVHTIGLGSLAGILVLTVLAFNGLRPRLLVALSIGVGLLAAISVCALLFERIHLITLVFGASLVGVAENYGTNWFCNRLGRPPEERWAMRRRQAPVMWLAMLTTVIGYALLALAPFPGLRQIAVFSGVGLLAAFVTVLWWFPFLDRRRIEFNRFAAWLGSRRALWPALGRNAFTVVFAVAVTGLVGAGLARLRSNDDIRLLQNSPPTLIEQQLRLGALLDLPSPAQFYLVTAPSEDGVLAAEEAVKQRLAARVADGALDGWQAVSDWVPSRERQQQDAALVARRIDGDGGVLALAAARLGETLAPAAAAAVVPLAVADWLAAPVSEPLRHQWLGRFGDGYASVMLLRGAHDPARFGALAAIAAEVPGVRFVDKVGEVSEVLARYRQLMGWVIVASYALVLVALCLRFGRRGWRALAPTAIASALAIALLALLGQPLQLFNVLALLLILGMGVDYGIFLLEQPGRSERRPFLSVTIAAACIELAFGLLALSQTPALRAFGLTMLFGIFLAWLLTPLFMDADHADA